MDSKKKLISWKKVACISAGVVLTGFVYLIYKNQDKLLYLNEAIPPKKTSLNSIPYQNPKQFDLNFSNIFITTPDKYKLHCWWIPQQQQQQQQQLKRSEQSPTILFFHQNAGNMGHRLPMIRKMFDSLGVNIFILSYRGYGDSEGVPSEKGLQIDATTTFQYIYENAETLKLDRQQIYLFGGSLGGAVATYVASKYSDKIAGLILENTFTSIANMIKYVASYLDWYIVKQYFLTSQWRSIDIIDTITCPIMFIVSTEDEIVPSEESDLLYERASGAAFKSRYDIPGATHNNSWMVGGNKYWEQISIFLHRCKNLQK